MFRKKKKRTQDLLVLFFLPFLAVVLSLLFKANFLLSSLLFFGLPAVYLSWRNRRAIAKSAIFALVFVVPLALFADYIAVFNKAWYVPATVFPFRIFGLVPLEDLVWGFLLIYLIIIFYEHFFDKTGREKVGKNLKYLAISLGIILVLFLVVLFTKPDLLYVKYAYFWLGLVLILVPLIVFLSFFSKLLNKYLKTASYFFVLALLNELTGLQLDQWRFPGTDFIGWVQIFHHRFPLEEFLFFFVLAAIWVLSYYEFFDDDRK